MIKKTVAILAAVTLSLMPAVQTSAEAEEPYGYFSSVFILPDYEKFMDPEYLYADIMADPDFMPMNSANIVLDFPENMIAVTEYDYNSDFCRFFGDQKIDNISGSINISCGNFDTPATTTVRIASLVFRKLSSGTAKFDFSGSSLHAHDGYGTNFIGFTGVHYIYLKK